MTDSPFKEETKEKTILRADAAVEALDADDVDGSVDGRSINAQRIVAGDVHSESSQSVESDLESSNGFKSVEPEPGSSENQITTIPTDPTVPKPAVRLPGILKVLMPARRVPKTSIRKHCPILVKDSKS